jgi:hypothetical protein
VKLSGLTFVASSSGKIYHSCSWASAQSCRSRNEQSAGAGGGLETGGGTTTVPSPGGEPPPPPPPQEERSAAALSAIPRCLNLPIAATSSGRPGGMCSRRLCSHDHPSSARKLDQFSRSSVESCTASRSQRCKRCRNRSGPARRLACCSRMSVSTHCGRSVKLDSACSTEHSDGSTKRGDSECLSL